MLGTAKSARAEVRVSMLMLDATGRVWSWGQTVQKPTGAGATTVTLRTAAAAPVGTPAAPDTGTLTVAPWATGAGAAPARVSRGRPGAASATNFAVPLAAGAAATEAPALIDAFLARGAADADGGAAAMTTAGAITAPAETKIESNRCTKRGALSARTAASGGVGDGPTPRARDQFGVFRQDTAGIPGRLGCPTIAPPGDFSIIDVEIDALGADIDRDAVPVGHEGDGPGVDRFGGDVADAEPPRAAREAPIGDEGAV